MENFLDVLCMDFALFKYPKIVYADTKIFFPFCYMNTKVKQTLKEYNQTEP